MKKGFELGGKYRDAPIGSQYDGPSLSQRKSSKDLGLTPSEQRQKNQLMRQFLTYDGAKGATEGYRSAPCWCDCGRGLRGDDGKCFRCSR